MQDFYQNSAIWSDGSTHHLNRNTDRNTVSDSNKKHRNADMPQSKFSGVLL